MNAYVLACAGLKAGERQGGGVTLIQRFGSAANLDGTTHLVMSPMAFMQRLAALVPRPRLHLIRYHGVLAPNARLRSQVVPQGATTADETADSVTDALGDGIADSEARPVHARAAHIGWARQLRRVFGIDMQQCPNCGAGRLRIIAAIVDRPAIEKILNHLGLQPRPPPRARAREADSPLFG